MAGTYDGDTLRLYIDGALSATQSVPYNILQPALARVGADLRPQYDGEFEFAVRIDDMCVVLTCPWHAWEFDVTTGDCLSRDGIKLIEHSVEIQDDDIVVSL